MTLPAERYRSLERVPDDLMRLLCERRLTKARLREVVRGILHHYPSPLDLERMRSMCKGILR